MGVGLGGYQNRPCELDDAMDSHWKPKTMVELVIILVIGYGNGPRIETVVPGKSTGHQNWPSLKRMFTEHISGPEKH
jgi:hypothetical protein